MALRSRLPVIVGELDTKTEAAVMELADRIVDQAQARVPTATGSLKAAIHVEHDGSSIRVVAGDSSVFYGHMVENGTTKMGARPFLVPAYEAERPLLELIAGSKLRSL